MATIEEVIVTAQKREQAAQDIPVSLSALTDTMLEQSGINFLEGIRDITAGLEIVSQSPGALQIAMRGVTNLTGNIESTAAVGYYLDESPISAFATAMPEFALWDAQRVEVLRGPQGTLFGEGSMGGTIRVITNRPDPTQFSGRLQGQLSSTDGGGQNYIARGVLNAPLSEGTLAMRLTFSRQDDSGWVEVPDLSLKDTNDMESTDLRFALGWTPSENLMVDFSVLHHEIDIGNTYGQTEAGLLDPQAVLSVAGPIGQLSTEETEYDLYNITVNYDLGWATFVSATSRFDMDRYTLLDLTPQMPLFFGVPGDSKEDLWTSVNSTSQEFRLVSNGDQAVDWTVGAFFKSNERELLQSFYFDLPAFGLVDETGDLLESDADSWAVFAELDYQITDAWSAKLGGRYYSDDRSLTTTTLRDSLIFGSIAGTVVKGSGDDSHFSPSVSLTWTGDETLFYAKISTGFRSGGTNPNASKAPDQIQPVYAPEELRAYELGWKNTLASGQVQLNAYLYYNDWSDLQLGFVTDDGLFGFTNNAGTAESTGGELELLWKPSSNLTWAINLGYTDAEITKDVYNAFGQLVAEAGNTIPFAPKLTVGTTFDYNWAVSNSLEGAFHVSYAYRDKTQSDAENFAETENDAYHMVRIRAGVQGDTWGLYAYANNLFDEVATTFRQNPVAATPLTYLSYIRPRTVGVELTWDF
jgi:outer membrane receptor protein involved in Fe transport